MFNLSLIFSYLVFLSRPSRPEVRYSAFKLKKNKIFQSVKPNQVAVLRKLPCQLAL